MKQLFIAALIICCLPGFGTPAYKNDQSLIKQDTTRKADSVNTTAKKTIIRICVPTKYSLLHPPLYVFMYKNKIITQTDSVNLTTKISPQDIKAIRVLKGDNATKKYGEKGKNGVIEMDLKYRKDKKLLSKSWDK